MINGAWPATSHLLVHVARLAGAPAPTAPHTVPRIFHRHVITGRVPAVRVLPPPQPPQQPPQPQQPPPQRQPQQPPPQPPPQPGPQCQMHPECSRRDRHSGKCSIVRPRPAAALAAALTAADVVAADAAGAAAGAGAGAGVGSVAAAGEGGAATSAAAAAGERVPITSTVAELVRLQPRSPPVAASATSGCSLQHARLPPPAHGCSLQHARLQPPAHGCSLSHKVLQPAFPPVAASSTHGCSLPPLRLQERLLPAAAYAAVRLRLADFDANLISMQAPAALCWTGCNLKLGDLQPYARRAATLRDGGCSPR